MPESLLVRLDGPTVAMLRGLIPVFRTTDLGMLVGQCIGLASASGEFIHDGLLSVVDPQVPLPEAANPSLVDLRLYPAAT